MPWALDEFNLCPPLDKCRALVSAIIFLFGMTTLQLVELIMHVSIKKHAFQEQWRDSPLPSLL